MHLQYGRMDEIDEEIEFQHSTMVRKNDYEWMSFRKKLKSNECILKSIFINRLFHEALIDEDKYIQSDLLLNRKKPYEYRGVQPVSKLIVWSNITMWASFVIVTAVLLDKPSSKCVKILYYVLDKIKDLGFLSSIIIISLVIFFLEVLAFWRRT